MSIITACSGLMSKPSSQALATDAAVKAVDTVAEKGVAGAISELAKECTQYYTAQKTCNQMGGFKAMGCKAAANLKYGKYNCPAI